MRTPARRYHVTARSEKLVFFDVDDDANSGDAMHLIDVERGAGAKTLGIMTKKRQPQSARRTHRLTRQVRNVADSLRVRTNGAQAEILRVAGAYRLA